MCHEAEQARRQRHVAPGPTDAACRLEDWARVPAEEMADLYRSDAARWHAQLDWDTTDTWDALERARRHGLVPGVVARLSDGAIGGWTYYLLHGRELQIGALTAATPALAATLLDAVLASPAATVAARALVFAFTAAPDVAALLAARGFDVRAQHYLAGPLARVSALDQEMGRRLGWKRVGAVAATVRPWHGDDLDHVAGLLAAAYGGPDPHRAFVPSGLVADWRLYAEQLTVATGCGRFQPALSRLAWTASGALAAAALVTAVSGTSAHLAQLAVTPAAAGTGLGTRLLAAVGAAAGEAGFARLSLLVSEDNVRARRLYERAGLAPAGAFVSATRSRSRVGQAGAPAA